MFQGLKERLGVLRASLPHPALLALLGVLQAAWLALVHFPAPSLSSAVGAAFLVPGWAWVLVWISVFYLTSLERLLGRKRKFDSVSEKFFKAYLNNLMGSGHALFEKAGERDFYSRINDWQHRVIEALGIGLGHQESERFFQKMDSLHPLTKAYRESQDKRDVEPLLIWLKGHLDELDSIRASLGEAKLLTEAPEVQAPEKPGRREDPGQLRLPGK